MCSIWSGVKSPSIRSRNTNRGAASRTRAIASRRFSSGDRAAGPIMLGIEPADAGDHPLETDLSEHVVELVVGELPARVADDQLRPKPATNRQRMFGHETDPIAGRPDDSSLAFLPDLGGRQEECGLGGCVGPGDQEIGAVRNDQREVSDERTSFAGLPERQFLVGHTGIVVRRPRWLPARESRPDRSRRRSC